MKIIRAVAAVPPTAGLAGGESADPYRHAFGKLLDGEERAEICRYGVEAATVDEPSAGLARSRVVSEIHEIDELRLAREIAVVGSRLGARGDKRLAVADVRTDGRRDHARRVRDPPQRCG